MEKSRSLLAATLVGVSALLVAGCPSGSRLENGEAHDETVPCPSSEKLLETYCAGSACHSPRTNGRAPKGGVDLTTADGVAAMIGGYSTNPSKLNNCPEVLLVDPADPTAGLLYQKLTNTQTCGTEMPKGGLTPTAYELHCLKSWAAGLASQPGLGNGGAGGQSGGGAGGIGGSSSDGGSK